jgi:hypothetical protein
MCAQPEVVSLMQVGCRNSAQPATPFTPQILADQWHKVLLRQYAKMTQHADTKAVAEQHLARLLRLQPQHRQHAHKKLMGDKRQHKQSALCFMREVEGLGEVEIFLLYRPWCDLLRKVCLLLQGQLLPPSHDL